MNLNLNNSKILFEYLINNENIPIVILTKDFKIEQYNEIFKKLIDTPTDIKNTLFEDTVGIINVTSEKLIDKNYSFEEINITYKSYSGSITYLQGSLITLKEIITIIFKNFMINESKIIDEISKINIEM